MSNENNQLPTDPITTVGVVTALSKAPEDYYVVSRDVFSSSYILVFAILQVYLLPSAKRQRWTIMFLPGWNLFFFCLFLFLCPFARYLMSQWEHMHENLRI